MPVFFRVDASRKIGSGHLVRCRLLARALQRNGIEATFLTATPNNALAHELRDENFRVLALADAETTSAQALLSQVGASPDPSLIVVDDHRKAFHIPAFQQCIRQAGFRLMMISFQHQVHFHADVVLNQNLLALERDYSVDEHTRLLLGPRYAVLDDAFLRLRSEEPPSVPNRTQTVLVTFGGADHTNQTRKAVDALAALEHPPRRLIVVVGGLYANTGELASYLEQKPRLNAELHVNTSDMPALMAASDLALSSGGLTAWELACLGVPNTILSTTDAERQTGQLLERKGYSQYLGHRDEMEWPRVTATLEALMTDRERRRRFAERSRELVDGCGTQRVVEHVKTLLKAKPHA